MAAVSNICSLPILPSNPKTSDWQYFIRAFKNYVTIVAAKESQCLPLLLNAIGRDGLQIFDGLADHQASEQFSHEQCERACWRERGGRACHAVI